MGHTKAKLPLPPSSHKRSVKPDSLFLLALGLQSCSYYTKPSRLYYYKNLLLPLLKCAGLMLALSVTPHLGVGLTACGKPSFPCLLCEPPTSHPAQVFPDLCRALWGRESSHPVS